MARTKPGHDELKFCPATIPPTGRGSGIPFDRLNSIFAGAVAGTAEPPNHRRVAVGKSGKRRADTPAAPEGFLVVRSGPEQRTGRQKITQRQARVLTFGVLPGSAVGEAIRHSQPIVNARGGVLFGQPPEPRPQRGLFEPRAQLAKSTGLERGLCGAAAQGSIAPCLTSRSGGDAAQ